MPIAPKTRRRFVIALIGLVGATVLVLGGTWLYVNVISGDAPDPFALDTSEPDAPSDPDTASGDTDLEGTWTVGAGSEAGYRVDEVLNGLDNTVVGRTEDVTGDIVVADGTATSGTVTVDMTTVTTDSDSRDSQFKGTIMNTTEFPTATFTLTEPVPLDGLANAGGPVELTVRGELTLRDVTREVDADVKMRMSGDAVQAAGSIPITFADFEIDAPNLAFVRVEQDGLVEFLLSFSRN